MTIDRRQFLRRSAITAVGFGVCSPLFESLATAMPLRRARSAATTDTGRVLVVINLMGGNDVLNTVVPVRQYERYRALRPSIGISRERLLPLPGHEELAFNPAMGAMRDLFGRGKLAVVAGVGMPSDTRGLFDHEACQINLQSATTAGNDTQAPPSGWVGRFLDTVAPGAITPGINLGGYSSLMMTGEQREALTIFALENFGVAPTTDPEARLDAYRRIQTGAGTPATPAARFRQVRERLLDQMAIVRERTGGYTPAVEYPADSALGASLLQSAQLVTADVGVRSIMVAAGTFDTHAAQVGASESDFNYHEYMWTDVSESLAAFQADLEAHGVSDNVVTLVVSEFGRRVYENNDLGTDHGYGGGMFVVGDRVIGGVYGDYPSLDDSRLVFDGNLDVTVDFRSVYATILGDYLGADPESVLGGRFPTLDFIA